MSFDFIGLLPWFPAATDWTVLLSPKVVVAFSLHVRILGERSTVHSLPALFFFFKFETRSRTLIPLLRAGSINGGSVS